MTAGLTDGSRCRAQVLDRSPHGLRLLFRPAVNLDRGMAIDLSNADGVGNDRAQVQWCHHKHRFTVAGIRSENLLSAALGV